MKIILLYLLFVGVMEKYTVNGEHLCDRIGREKEKKKEKDAL